MASRPNAIQRLTLRSKVTLLLLAVSLGPLFIAGIINVNRAVERGKRSERLHYAQSAGHAAQAFGDLFQGVLSDLRRLARRFPVDTFDFDRAEASTGQALLRASVPGWDDAVLFTELDTDYNVAFAALPDGRIFYLHPYHATGTIELRDEPWFENIPPSGRLVMARMEQFSAGERAALIGVVPIRRDNKTHGYLGVVLAATRLDEIAQRAQSVTTTRPDVHVYLGLVDAAGELAAGSTLPSAAARAVLAGLPSAGTDEVEADGESLLVARQRVDGTRWRAQLITPTREAYRPVYQLIWLLVGIIVLTFLFVLLFADYLATVMLRPITALERGAEMIGKGALDYRIELSRHSGDGLGSLARAFNTMGDNLEAGARDVRAYSRSLEDANQELDAMVYGITHDLKKSLRGIDAFATFLEEDYEGFLDDDGVGLLHKIGGNVEHISKLADDLIALVEQRREQAEATRFLTSELLAEAASRVLEEAPGVINLPDDPPEVTADRARLLLVFTNLIHNGLKFNRSSTPTVDVTWADEGTEIRFEVTDNGIGVDPDYHEHIFGLFHRLNDQTEFPGSGTGLNLARRIMQQHRGELSITSSPDQGSTFTLRLPKEASFVTSPGVRLDEL